MSGRERAARYSECPLYQIACQNKPREAPAAVPTKDTPAPAPPPGWPARQPLFWGRPDGRRRRHPRWI